MTGVSTAAATTTRARRVLVIEDEVLIAMVLEDMLDILGHVVVATAATFAEAAAAIAAGGFDLVVADVNLGAEPIYPLADRVLAAGIALILATGSHRDTLPPRFADVPILEKPYLMGAIGAAIEQIP
jgi:CheY-like chemotaxis protein